MKAKILTFITMMTLAVGGVALLPTGAAYAACNDTQSKKEITESIGQTGESACNDNGVDKIIRAIVSILSYVVGIAAIIMIIASGFKYITSGGDSGKISSAKNTLIYALVGLIIAALAQLLVRFVLTQAVNAGDGCSSGYTRRASDNKCVPG